jgi:AraC family transcriptional regulator
MDTYLHQLLEQLPLLSSEFIEVYAAKKVVIFKSRHMVINTQQHHCYEFIVPFAEQVSPLEGKKNFSIKQSPVDRKGKITNDLIEHNVFYYTPICVECEFLEQISKDIFGGKKVPLSKEGCSTSPRLHSIIKMFIHESRNRRPGYELVLQSLSTQLVVQLLREATDNNDCYNEETLEQDRKNIRRAIDFLQAHYRDQFTLEQIARSANYSPYHFIRVFKGETGKTPFEYLLELKIEKAKEMLLSQSTAVSETCFYCGFNNLSHFTAVFKKKVGMTPSEYRKQAIAR